MAELFNSLPDRTRFTHFAQYLIAYCSQQERASDVISDTFVGLIVLDKPVKYPDPRLNRYREILPKAVGGGIFRRFFRDNSRSEVDSDVISSADVGHIGVDEPVKFGDSASNYYRDRRLPHFLTNDGRRTLW